MFPVGGPGGPQQCMPCCPRPPCTSPYTYSSVPRALFAQRKKYRNPPPSDGPPYGNLMFDRRVVRGSTYAQHPIPTDCGESQAARQMEARRRALARRRAQGMQTRARCRIGTPPPLPGRKHEPVQTEKFLEELWERPPERDVGCQTELFLDRPESPFYVPAKTGADVATQIYPGDLFDFDVEVVPILEVLVGKTLQQAMLEVLEEEELAALRAQQNRFMEMRAAEEAERRRLEEQERRLREEAESRLKEFEEAQRLAKETEARVAAAVLTQGYLADLLPSVLEGLRDSGYLMDECMENVRQNFMPWLMEEVQQELNTMVHSREIIMEMVREILEQRADLYREMAEEDAEKLGLSDEEMGSEKEPEEPLDLLESDREDEEEEWTGKLPRGYNADDWGDPNNWDDWDKVQGQQPDWDQQDPNQYGAYPGYGDQYAPNEQYQYPPQGDQYGPQGEQYPQEQYPPEGAQGGYQGQEQT